MSIIFGVQAPDNAYVEASYLKTLARATERYAPDGTFVGAGVSVGMGFQPYHTHERSKLETQPAIDGRGNMLGFDGRLDNHEELRTVLGLSPQTVADSSIVLAAYERWSESCFARLEGDWALALWSKSDRSLYLARDHAGTRTLYYEMRHGGVMWSTYLETFLADGVQRDLENAYIACYLTCQPLRDLTPYKGIRAVTPAHYLRIVGQKMMCMSHWNWTAKSQLRYRTDSEYAEHFLALFRQSVEKRTVPGAPILAQLSGGVDSSSIVCMSDHIRSFHGSESEQLLDTISYYNDDEPNWDEKPYFSLVEAKRKKVGIHVDTSQLLRSFTHASPLDAIYLLPGADSRSFENESHFGNLFKSKGYRVILSGLGGDELLGGVPMPLPELADHLFGLHLVAFIKRATAWSLERRTPLIHMLFRTLAFGLQVYELPHPTEKLNPPWITGELIRLTEHNYLPPIEWFERLGRAPSAINNAITFRFVMDTLPHLTPGATERREYRYPFLDRELLNFLFRIPREQLIRPGRRRHLMRRALANIVPSEILDRRRKAFLARTPILLLQEAQSSISDLFADSLAAKHGFIDLVGVRSALQYAREGNEYRWSICLLRAIGIELWLRHLHEAYDIGFGAANARECALSPIASRFPVDRSARCFGPQG
jgi:asparagine synthase (glutamine-hydrolysing)